MDSFKVLLPGWETVRVIGSGSSGKVYELKKNDEYGGDFHSALKVITIPATQKEYDEMVSTMSEFAMRSKLRDKVEEISNEYRLMGVLKGHPNIVNCEDQMIIPHDEDLGWDIYIRMELLDSLPNFVSERGMTAGEVIKLGIDICSALELCRENKIIHRDIKPQNIFVSKYGGFKLGDFGVAKTTSIKGSTDLVGTYSYMAPEVYRGKEYDDRVDIYSLGMVLYWLLNERRGPFLALGEAPTAEQSTEAQMRRYRGEPLPPPKNGNQALKKLVLKACAYDRDDRFASPTEMKKALILAANGKTEESAAIPLFDTDATVKDDSPRMSAQKPVQAPVFDTKPAPKPAPKQAPKPQPKPAPKPEGEKKKKDDDGGKTGSQLIVALAVIVFIAAVAFAIFMGISNGWFKSKPDTPKTSEPVQTSEPAPTPTPKVSKIILSSPRLTLTAGDEATLNVSYVPEELDTPEYVWRSSDNSIVTVDEKGNVTAVNEGTATIMVYLADDMDVYDECMVEVEAPYVTELSIEEMPTKTVYFAGEELDTTGLVLRAYYNNGSEERITNPEEYSVECDMSGLGNKTATVSYGGKTAEFTVRVSLFG